MSNCQRLANLILLVTILLLGGTIAAEDIRKTLEEAAKN